MKTMNWRTEIRTDLNEWLENWKLGYTYNCDYTFIIYYTDGSMVYINDYFYDGERVRKQNILNIEEINPFGHYDFNGEVGV